MDVLLNILDVPFTWAIELNIEERLLSVRGFLVSKISIMVQCI